MEWIAVGRITKTHGLKGEVKMHPFMVGEDLFEGLRHVRLVEQDQPPVEGVLQYIRGHGTRRILKIQDCDTVEQAQALVGRTLHALRKEFKPLPEGEYYSFDILGLNVFDESGRGYGTVTEIIETGSNDVYVVRDGARELLLPMIDWVVRSIDLKEKKLVFRVVEGLLEDYSI